MRVYRFQAEVPLHKAVAKPELMMAKVFDRAYRESVPRHAVWEALQGPRYVTVRALWSGVPQFQRN